MHAIQTYIQQHKQDAILYKADYLLSQDKEDPILHEQQIVKVCELLSFLQGTGFVKSKYADLIGKKHKLKPADLIRQSNKYAEEREELQEKEQVLKEGEKALPKWIDKEKFYTYGFDSRVDGIDNTGIYFHTGSQGSRQLTNFIMKPLIHVYAQNDIDNRRLTEVNNGISRVVLQLPSKAFTSVEAFESILMNEGVFFTHDGFGKSQLNKLKSVFLKEYPKCFELKTLGWQPEGFFAYSNKLVNGTLIDFNEYGYAEVGGTNFLSMSASSIQRDVRSEDDIYENDRYLSWMQSSIDFSTWAKLMSSVYGRSGWVAIAYALVSLYRDIVFKVDNYCPLLYAYGAVQAGKSKYAESLSNLFFKEMPAFNLNQGTDFAFFSRLERFRNCPVVLNEFDENAIKEEWFRAIKAAFDGEGREKGRGQKEKTKTQKINCTVVIVGQYLSTKDDNSVLTRCIPLAFKENNSRTEEQLTNYDLLKGYEKQGLGGILVELLHYRAYVAGNYAEMFSEVSKEMSREILKEGVTVKARILKNFCTTLTMVKLLQEKLNFPFSFDEYFEYCKADIMKLSSHISESDSLAAFWKMLEFLLDQELLQDGSEFKIELKDEVSIMSDRANTEKRKFDEPKRLLYLRLDAVHPLYMETMRRQTGKNGINKETILLYMKDQPYFIGTNKGSSFRNNKGKTTVTSSYILDYDQININLIRIQEEAGSELTLEGAISPKGCETIDVLGVPKLKFTLVDDQSYEKDGHMVDKRIYITCYCVNIGLRDSVTANRKVRVTGVYTERKKNEVVFRSMEVASVELVIDPMTVPSNDIPF